MVIEESHQLRTIPGTEIYEFKEGFIKRYSKITDWEEFKRYSLSFLRRSIRVNTLKASVEEVTKSILAKGWHLEPVPWCKQGFWISHPTRRDVGNLLEHHLGLIYVQEAASMIPPLVLDPQPGEIILDLCAAPGSKTTQIAAMMQNTGLVVANDLRGSRNQALGLNLQRLGIVNTIVSLQSGVRIPSYGFDRVLVDAPCSGTGTIRKSLKTIRMWNPNMVRKICNDQRQLAVAGFKALKPGGVMVYSTCSLEPEENEGMVNYLLEQFDDAIVEKVDESAIPGLKIGKAVTHFEGKVWNPQVKNTLRIWPQNNDTEGFFVAKIRKLEK